MMDVKPETRSIPLERFLMTKMTKEVDAVLTEAGAGRGHKAQEAKTGFDATELDVIFYISTTRP